MTPASLSAAAYSPHSERTVRRTRLSQARSASAPPSPSPCLLVNPASDNDLTTDASSLQPSHQLPSQPQTPMTHTPASLSRPHPGMQAVAVLASSGIFAFVMTEQVPAAARLGVLAYLVWAAGEWIVHKYFMHAKVGSFGDRATHLNRLHVQHHLDTARDMTMKPGFDIHAIYFHLPNSAVQVVAGSAILSALDFALHLHIPLAWTPAAAALATALHGVAWNTMHMEMHGVQAHQVRDGLPCLPYNRRVGWHRPYVQWVIDNHTTHHECGGGMNFNVVCPGPDLVMGTYLQRSWNVEL